MNLTDEELLTQYLTTKDGDLFEEFDRRMRPRIYKLALKKLHSDHAAAEDITQDVLIKLMTMEPRTFDPSVADLAFTITRNFCKNYFRGENSGVRRGMEPLGSLKEECEPTYEIEPEEDLEKRRDYLEAVEAIGRLPSPYKEAVTQYYCKNETYKQSARSLKMNLDTLKTHLHRGLQLLRAELGGLSVSA